MGRVDSDGDLDVATETLLQNSHHYVNDAIFVHDGDTGAILAVNRTACEMYGYTREELIQLSLDDLSSGSPPYTEANAIERVKSVVHDGPQVFEWKAKDAGGEEFWVEVSINGTSIDDHPITFVIVRDISARKRHEQRLETQRDNLEVLNQVVRHDIRNDLQLVQGYAELLQDDVSEDGLAHLTTIQHSATHAIRLTQTARDLAEVMLDSDLATNRISLADTLDQELTHIRSEQPEADISIETPVPDVTVQGNDMLGSVFRNLLRNGIQHNDKAVPVVAVSVTEVGDAVRVRIADNGPGIPDAQKDTIFGKGEKGLDSAGTGIGLYLVTTLVEGYNGEVWVEDNAPEGAVFVVELPRIES